mmetsp:Transcript_25671/g.60191  ORF Transcript_25671/g.60191 Transcript_25671/m.60191 type:complete len:110 (+) Transcript_25671:379-708(+)
MTTPTEEDETTIAATSGADAFRVSATVKASAVVQKRGVAECAKPFGKARNRPSIAVPNRPATAASKAVPTMTLLSRCSKCRRSNSSKPKEITNGFNSLDSIVPPPPAVE